MRRTKIVCTIGPSTSDYESIKSLIEAGMDVARLNFSHGSQEDHAERVEILRRAADDVGKVVPIMQDLQGPKIRIGEMKAGGVLLHKGQTLTLTTDPLPVGDEKLIRVDYDSLVEDVVEGGTILIDDGQIELKVIETSGDDVITEVIVGGPLRSRKGVHLPMMKSTQPPLTEKDINDLEFGLKLGVDIVALSFVRAASDVKALLDRIRKSGRRVWVVAKIEKPEAVDRIDQILVQADAIMVARGDLGIEMPLSKVPRAQKLIIRRCLAAAKPVITATQMLESMIDNPRPTRAEASDVANAVLDGSDALMLSAETAAGKYPIRSVEVMSTIIKEAEKSYDLRIEGIDHRPRDKPEENVITESVSYTAYQLAEHTGAKSIACLTATGTTARTIARHRPSMPLYAFTDDPEVVRQLGLLWGTKAIQIPFQHDTDEGVQIVHKMLIREGLAVDGDRIVITAGMPLPSKGRTNMVHVSDIVTET